VKEKTGKNEKPNSWTLMCPPRRKSRSRGNRRCGKDGLDDTNIGGRLRGSVETTSKGGVLPRGMSRPIRRGAVGTGLIRSRRCGFNHEKARVTEEEVEGGPRGDVEGENWLGQIKTNLPLRVTGKPPKGGEKKTKRSRSVWAKGRSWGGGASKRGTL